MDPVSENPLTITGFAFPKQSKSQKQNKNMVKLQLKFKFKINRKHQTFQPFRTGPSENTWPVRACAKFRDSADPPPPRGVHRSLHRKVKTVPAPGHNHYYLNM